MKTVDELTRPNIRALKPYSSARDEYKGTTASVFLDANESPYNSPLNRYPDPLQRELKEAVASKKGVRPGQVFLGNGSDEAIDLLFRAFCEPRQDNVVAIDPTYGMYQVCAGINGVEYRKVLLDADYRLSARKLLAAVDEHTKLIFLCSPNNPTGNDLHRGEIEILLNEFDGLLVVDEAYNDFSSAPSWLSELDARPRLVVLQTFSKAWASAGIRLGMAFASEAIVGTLNKIKYPYNVNALTLREAMNLLRRTDEIDRWVHTLKEERARLESAMEKLPCVVRLFPSAANFLLVRMTDADAVYAYLTDRGIVVRNRSAVTLCGNCLRITVGTREENETLITALQHYTA